MAGAHSTPEPSDSQKALGPGGLSLAAAAGAVTVWGLVPVALRHFIETVDPLTFSAIRFFWMAVFGLPLFLRSGAWRWPKRDQLRLALCAVLAIAGLNIPSALAARKLSAGGLGLVSATEPVMIAGIALIALGLPIGRRLIVGSLIAFFGVVVALSRSADGVFDSADLAYIGLGLLGALSWSVHSVAGSALSRRYGSSNLTGGVLTIGGLAGCLPLIVLRPDAVMPGTAVILQIALLALSSSLVGFLLWNFAAIRMRPAPLGLTLYLIPATAILGGAALLGESITVRETAGAGLILFGVGLGEGRLRLRL